MPLHSKRASNVLPPRLHTIGGDLGSRVKGAFDRAFGEGVRRAVIVGTDCPGATALVLQTAFDRLADHDLMLGPASDGGYHLIALRRPVDASAVRGRMSACRRVRYGRGEPLVRAWSRESSGLEGREENGPRKG